MSGSLVLILRRAAALTTIELVMGEETESGLGQALSSLG